MRTLILLLLVLLPLPALAAPGDAEIVRLLRQLAAALSPRTAPVTSYLSPTGQDSAPCSQSQPCATFAHALSRMQAGDTLLLRAGTYTQGIDSQSHALPSGLSWEQPTTIAASPGEQVTLQGGYINVNGYGSQTYQYLVFRGFTIDLQGGSGSGIFAGGPLAHHLRFDTLEVTRARQGVQGNCAHCEYLRLHVHHNGSDHLQHGFYVCPTQGLIQGNHIHHNAGYGLQVYDKASDGCSTGTRIEGNTLHDNCTSGGGCGEMTVNHGSGLVVANNVVYNALVNGIELAWGTLRDALVAHNTVYHAGGSGVYVSTNNQQARIVNNLLYRTSGVDNRGVGTTVQGNPTTDPLYVDAAAGNFHLQATSPALDRAGALASVPTDKDGVARPQGPAADLGAYERLSTTPPPEPPPGGVTLACEGTIAAVPGRVQLSCVPQEGGRR